MISHRFVKLASRKFACVSSSALCSPSVSRANGPIMAQGLKLSGLARSNNINRLYRVPSTTCSSTLFRSFSSESEDPRNAPRDQMEFDVVIVGGGPAGLSAAIHLKQIDSNLNVCVVEKSAEIGGHILSGNVFEPHALDELIPNWRDLNSPLTNPAKKDEFYFLLEKMAFRTPTPPSMHNEGNFIMSLSDFCRWLGEQAEGLGVEIFCGFAGSEVLYDEKGAVRGVATGDVGISRDGKVKDNFERGIELVGKQTLFAEGCRGSLTKKLYKKYNLGKDCQPQTYGIGLKELWEVPEENHDLGKIMHTIGWPILNNTWAGSFMYHMENNRIAVGYVVGLDYDNPYLHPYNEFQRLKHHPLFEQHLKGGQCISYGARALNEGGIQSIPRLTFPGGALIGCSAGFLNVPKVKGTHTAMKSAMLAAEAVSTTIRKGETEAREYEAALKDSWVYKELHSVRNIRPSLSKFGLVGFMGYSAMELFVTRGRVPWTFNHHGTDHESLKPAAECEKIEYPKPDGKLSFDLLSNLSRSGTNHEGDQPIHLKLTDPTVATKINLAKYAGPEGRFCPAKVYEFVEDAQGESKLVINAQNCLHCKTCDIKDPTQNINWVPPQGGGGPAYRGM